MNGEPIGKRDDAQDTTAEFRHRSPKPESVVLLRFRTNRILDNSNAHFLGEVRPTRKHVVLEVGSELEVRHAERN